MFRALAIVVRGALPGFKMPPTSRVLCTSVDMVNRAVEAVEDAPVLSLDLEWEAPGVGRSGSRPGPVAVLQFAHAKRAWVIHLSVIGSFPASLRRLLSDKNLEICGVNIAGDLTRLAKVRDCAATTTTTPPCYYHYYYYYAHPLLLLLLLVLLLPAPLLLPFLLLLPPTTTTPATTHTPPRTGT